MLSTWQGQNKTSTASWLMISGFSNVDVVDLKLQLALARWKFYWGICWVWKEWWLFNLFNLQFSDGALQSPYREQPKSILNPKQQHLKPNRRHTNLQVYVVHTENHSEVLYAGVVPCLRLLPFPLNSCRQRAELRWIRSGRGRSQWRDSRRAQAERSAHNPQRRVPLAATLPFFLMQNAF